MLDKAETAAPGVGALRLRTVATKAGRRAFALRDEAGKYLPEVLLDLDYWVLVPTLRRGRARQCAGGSQSEIDLHSGIA